MAASSGNPICECDTGVLTSLSHFGMAIPLVIWEPSVKFFPLIRAPFLLMNNWRLCLAPGGRGGCQQVVMLIYIGFLASCFRFASDLLQILAICFQFSEDKINFCLYISQLMHLKTVKNSQKPYFLCKKPCSYPILYHAIYEAVHMKRFITAASGGIAPPSPCHAFGERSASEKTVQCPRGCLP